MPKGNEEVHLSAENALIIALMYDLLSDENKRIVNQMIEHLKAEQSNCQ